jgi:transcriptional regulator GlxA family with amidase domain
VKSVELVLFPQANGLDITGPLEVFSVASKIVRTSKPGEGYEVLFTGEKPGPVTLESGLSVNVEKRCGETDTADYLVIPGGSDPAGFSSDQQRLSYLGERAKRAHRIVSICTGAFILAKLGLLNGRRCTTHWRYASTLAEQYPSIDVCENAIYIEDGNVFTSAGVTAGIDLALALVERDYGADIAIETARALVLYFRRPGNQSQFSTPIELRKKAGSRFRELHEWLLENISRPELQVETLADFMAMSPRHFSRCFHRQTGMTPGKYLESIRLEKARELLGTTTGSIKSIAYLCGFPQEERLRRLFIKQLGITPSQYRCHFGVADSMAEQSG